MSESDPTTTGTERVCGRLVVTGVGPDQRSRVVFDGPASPRAVTPVFTTVELWQADAVPVIGSAESTLAGAVSIEPPPGGVLVRLVTFPPDRLWKDSGGYDGALAEIGGASTGAGEGPSDRVPGMHITETVDVVTVVEGVVHVVLQDGEAELRVGDTLVQRGTRHAWSNRTDRPATVVATLLSGRL